MDIVSNEMVDDLYENRLSVWNISNRYINEPTCPPAPPDRIVDLYVKEIPTANNKLSYGLKSIQWED